VWSTGCYPFFDGDPFLLRHTPGIYAIGNQPSFASELVVGLAAGEDRVDGSQGGERTRTRVVLVPRFSTSGEVVFVHSGTLAVKRMRFGLASGWASG
jgi:DNA polymerase delta subunit 2